MISQLNIIHGYENGMNAQQVLTHLAVLLKLALTLPIESETLQPVETDRLPRDPQ